jgi:outer membrane protein OmpA-like peptidoglycan-associated protein
MKTKLILLCSVALALGACGTDNSMHRTKPESSGSRYTPRADITQRNYTNTNLNEDRLDKKRYNDYEHREQCQNYRGLPRNMIDQCVREESSIQMGNMRTEHPQKALPIVRSYTVLFDHDRANLRANENETLDRAMNEIAKYNPRQITVTGYTDSSGTADYNQALSRKREQTVSAALLRRGIQNQTLDREARGENDQAVDTQDSVRNQDNRRVVIDFRR